MDEVEARSRLKRMVAADSVPTLSDGELDDLVTIARTTDRYGALPDDDSWTPTYRLARAAMEGWRWKMAKVVGNYDFSSDGASYSRSQVLAHCQLMIAEYGKKAGVSVVPATSASDDTTSDVIGSL